MLKKNEYLVIITLSDISLSKHQGKDQGQAILLFKQCILGQVKSKQ